MHDPVPKSRHLAHGLGEIRPDHAILLEKREQLSVIGRSAESIGRDDVRGDLDTAFDRVLHGVKNGVLPFTIGSKVLQRNRSERLQISAKKTDPIDPLLDSTAVGDHAQAFAAKYSSRYGLKSR